MKKYLSRHPKILARIILRRINRNPKFYLRMILGNLLSKDIDFHVYSEDLCFIIFKKIHILYNFRFGKFHMYSETIPPFLNEDVTSIGF